MSKLKFKWYLYVWLFPVVLAISAYSQVDTLRADTSIQRIKSPVGALIRSAILPGLGQFYNEAYWKIPVIYGVGAYLVYEIIQFHRQYKIYRDLYIESLKDGGYGDLRYRRVRDFYRDQRDLFGAYLFILYAANIIDAYVDAHLYNFDVGESLSIQLMPGKVKFSFKFKTW
jgi:hypothetical protein